MNNSNAVSSVTRYSWSIIPNILTLLNLVFGCLAIVSILQPGLTTTTDEGGTSLIILPQQMIWASFYIGCAAVIDFLDGFVARLFKASSSLGIQLDSLSDVVSFGVAPGFIIYTFLRYSFSQLPDGLNISTAWLLPAFLFPCAGAYRLARFNIDTEQSQGFKGVPIPAAGLLIASFPLIYFFINRSFVFALFLNQWFWYAVILIVSYLMISTLPMLALKFKNVSVKSLLPFIIVAVLTLITALIGGWLAVPVAFIAYVILSLIFKPSTLHHHV
ncbi:MAG: CDP-alcohol phosphatidyltransferase family protein [Bacteroidota bacterium]|nr:CDP-alcohol phosphatidyltransferase family protein [Bacteroidota bacterium]